MRSATIRSVFTARPPHLEDGAAGARIDPLFRPEQPSMQFRGSAANIGGHPRRFFGNSLGFHGYWIGTMKLRFGDFTFNGETRQLLRGSEEVHLSPKAFELLKILIEQRPRALSKQELHERLWPDTFVSEVNLASLIAEIRAALGDTAQNSIFIRTARRFG